MAKRKYIVSWVLAALLVALNISSVGATVPVAVNPNLPVAAGAGGGVGVNGGTAGLSRSTIQNPVFTGVNTNVSAIPSANGNETAALYRPGGTYLITFEETQAQTVTTPLVGPFAFTSGGGFGLGGDSFTFSGIITQARVSLSNGATADVQLLYATGSTVNGATAPIGTTLLFTGTAVLPGGGLVLNNANTVVTGRTAVSSFQLTSGTYIVRTGFNAIVGGSSTPIPMGAVLSVGGGSATTQVYNSGGTAVYNTVLVRPPTFNPPNGTSTGEPTAADVVNPFTSTGKVSVFIGNGYANPPGSNTGGGSFFSRPPQSQP